ncbi:MAG: YetF domain-containing protein [Pirellulales bacterium]
MWANMFDLDLSMLEKIIRPVIVYAFLIVGFRLAGKRELAQLNAMDLVVLLVIANTVQNAIIGNDNSVTGGLIGAATLLALNYAVVRYLFAHPRFDRLVEGEPTPLVQHGTMQRDRMQRELITKFELEIAAHRQGFASLDEIDKAVLEPSGVISFVGKEPPPAEVLRGELTSRLDAISRQLADVERALAGRA